jgi:hypothetical protein
MKRIALVGLVTAAALSTAGCFSTPAYTARERNEQIARNWRYESEQLIDDFDHALLLRPASRMTLWNIVGE